MILSCRQKLTLKQNSRHNFVHGLYKFFYFIVTLRSTSFLHDSSGDRIHFLPLCTPLWWDLIKSFQFTGAHINISAWVNSLMVWCDLFFFVNGCRQPYQPKQNIHKTTSRKLQFKAHMCLWERVNCALHICFTQFILNSSVVCF